MLHQAQAAQMAAAQQQQHQLMQQQMPQQHVQAAMAPIVDASSEERRKKGRGRKQENDEDKFAPVNKKKAQNLSIDIGMSLEVESEGNSPPQTLTPTGAFYNQQAYANQQKELQKPEPVKSVRSQVQELMELCGSLSEQRQAQRELLEGARRGIGSLLGREDEAPPEREVPDRASTAWTVVSEPEWTAPEWTKEVEEAEAAPELGYPHGAHDSAPSIEQVVASFIARDTNPNNEAVSPAPHGRGGSDNAGTPAVSAKTPSTTKT